jgi:hypothetical protein
MGYVRESGQVTRYSPPAAIRVSQPGLGSLTSLSTSVSAVTNPISSAVGAIAGIFGGGSDRNQKIPIHKAMIQQMYNYAVQGDVVNAQKLLWCITGDYNENKSFAAALWQQLQTTAPKVYQAANAAGAYAQPKGVDITVSPFAPNSSLVGAAPAPNSAGAMLSGMASGGSSLLLPALALAAVFAFKK